MAGDPTIVAMVPAGQEFNAFHPFPTRSKVTAEHKVKPLLRGLLGRGRRGRFGLDLCRDHVVVDGDLVTDLRRSLGVFVRRESPNFFRALWTVSVPLSAAVTDPVN